MSQYTKEERETVININEAEKTASVYSCSAPWIHKMRKLAKEFPDQVKVEREYTDGVSFTVPKQWIKVRPPRQMSDEQRAQASERLKLLRRSRSAEPQETEDDPQEQ